MTDTTSLARSARWLRWIALLGLASVLALLASAAPPAPPARSEPVVVTFLDVGQGDAVLVQAPEGQTALIDAGPGMDLRGVLAELGVERLDLVVATHPHADHIGGMREILESIPVRFYMDNGRPHTTATYRGVMQTLQRRPDITYLEAVPRTLELGSVRIEVLPIPPDAGSNLNDASVGLVVEHGDFRAFLSGDSEQAELTHFLEAGVVPDVTLLKAPHHGSDDAVSEAFLDAARPELVVISVGFGNTYGHPSAAALATYPRHADELFRTDRHGRVTVSGHEDGSYEVSLGGAATLHDRVDSPGGAP